MLTLPAVIKKGVAIPELKDSLAPYEGYKCQIKVVKGVFKPVRSNSQNSYFHGVIIPLILEAMHTTGSHIQDNAAGEPRAVTAEVVKEMLKGLFCPRDLVVLPNGDTASIVRGTSDLDTAEFLEFCEKCRAFAAQYLDCYIPDPS